MWTMEARRSLLSAVRLKKNNKTQHWSSESNLIKRGSRDSCTICMTWTLKERNEVRSFEARSTRVFLRQGPGEGTPSMLGDMDVPPFWPPFLTFWGLNSIFLGYFFSSTNTKPIFWGIQTTNSYRIRSFRPQISFFPRSFWVQFSAASGTPPSVFGPSTPPPPPPPPPPYSCTFR